MTTVHARLEELGLTLPEVAAPVAAYVPAVQSGKQIITSGQLPFVNGSPEFTGQPAVANGASELVGQIFGEAGAHARAAVGVAVLPLNACVEVELVAEVR